jgi:hypothetical protein
MQRALMAQEVQAPVPDAPSEHLAVPLQLPSPLPHIVAGVELEGEGVAGGKRKRVLSQTSKLCKVKATKRWRTAKREDETVTLQRTILIQGWGCLNDLKLPAPLSLPLQLRQKCWAKCQLLQWMHRDLVAKHAGYINHPHAQETQRRMVAGLAFLVAVEQEALRQACYKVTAISEALQMAAPPLPVISCRVDLLREAQSLGGQMARCATGPRLEELTAKLALVNQELLWAKKPNALQLTLDRLRSRASAAGLADRWTWWWDTVLDLVDQTIDQTTREKEGAQQELEELDDLIKADGSVIQLCSLMWLCDVMCM